MSDVKAAGDSQFGLPIWVKFDNSDERSLANVLNELYQFQVALTPPKIKVKKLRLDAVVPAYQTKGAAALDIVGLTDVTIPSDAWAVIETGLSLEIPPGWEAQVRPRSGSAYKNGVTVLNSPGTIDSDYRGELKVLLVNHGFADCRIKAGDRVAQLVIARAQQAVLVEVEELSETERGARGFGSTGK